MYYQTGVVNDANFQTLAHAQFADCYYSRTGGEQSVDV